MSQQVVLITGALTGIGRATAFAFAKEGAQIVVAGRHDAAGATLAAELGSQGVEAEFVKVDVRHEDQVEALITATIHRFGRLDAAVNNAGTEGVPGMVMDQTPETYAATFDTNVLGTLLSMKHEMHAMKRQGSGSIVNISSTLAHRGAPGGSLYSASKHAIEGLTKSAAIEAASFGVRINCVAPGPTDTGMLTRFTGTPENKAQLVLGVPMGRLGRPEELAQAIVFLSSEKAGFISGISLVVDGGKESQDAPVGQG